MVLIGLITYKCLLFVSGVSYLGLSQLVFFAEMSLWWCWYCFMGVLLSVLLLVGRFLPLLG